jgi:hypothetical protein
MSSVGAAATASANVYVASGNGAFACTGSGTTQQCTSASAIPYFGESAIQFPAGVYPNVQSGTYLSGLSSSGSGYCELDFTSSPPLPQIAGIALVQVPASQNAQLTIYQGGANYTTAPSAATTKPSTIQGYPPATSCTGTVTISTQLTSTVALSPQDFYTPYANRYQGLFPGYDGNASSFLMAQELSRLDLDFGVCGPVVMPHAGVIPFLMTCDKTSILYVMPMPEITGVSLGQFQVQDVGLTNGSGSGSTWYATEWPFKITRSATACEKVDQNGASNGIISGTPCHEVHSIPWFNDLAVVWPTSEQVELFQGTLTSAPHLGGGTLTSYSFGNTGPAFDPCQVLPSNCTGNPPPFPAASGNSKGGLMAIAASNQAPPATLWAVVPQLNQQSGQPLGSLFAYQITFQNPPTPASLTNFYSWTSGAKACKNDTAPLNAWFTPAFTEPTLANGAVYVPTLCGVTATDPNYPTYNGCGDVPAPVSGILVFSTCP